MHKLLGAISNPEEFKRLLLEFDKQRLALEALTRLSAYSDEFDGENTESLASLLFDEGDRLIENYIDDLREEFSVACCHMIEVHLEKLAARDEKFEVLKSSFEKKNGVYLPAVLLRRERSRAEDYKKRHEPRGVSRDQMYILEEAQLDELREICVRHFNSAAETGSLQSNRQLKDILFFWLYWDTSPNPAKEFFRKLVQTDEGLLLILESFLGEKVSEDYGANISDFLFEKGLSEFEYFMSVEEVKARVEAANRNMLSDRAQKLCEVFMKLYEDREEKVDRLPLEVEGQSEPEEKSDRKSDNQQSSEEDNGNTNET